MSEKVYLDGVLIDSGDARISAFDAGFLYGYGVFETVRAWNRRPFRLCRHLERLSRSCNLLRISTQGIDFEKAVHAVLAANNLSNARIRITVSPGRHLHLSKLARYNEPVVVVTASHLEPETAEVFESGFKIITSAFRRSGNSIVSRIKSTSYLECLLARHEALADGADDALILNECGLVCEASMSNIFVVKNGILATPDTRCPILPGITREAVIELAHSMNFDIQETQLELEDIKTADEAFLTNSIIGIMPVVSVNGKPLSSGKPGPVSRQIRQRYNMLVDQETGRPA